MLASRTTKSLHNSAVALFFYVLNLVLSFYSRKIFLEYLGTEILGLNTTAMNLLQFLNLAELGINAGVSFTLYKPLHENDNVSINEIVSLQGKLYRRIACIIIAGAVILMFFFPLLFNKITLPIWYAYASFSVMLFSALLGYFVNYKQILLTASQQDYKVIYSYKTVILLKTLAQMTAVYYFVNGYDWWLVLEVVFAIIASVSLNYMTKKTFPFLSDVKISFKELCLKYHTFTVKIKQLFFHKIAGFALTQSSPLIIYAYSTLTLVALYGNYLIIINGIQILLSSIFNGINAGIGNLVAEGDKSRQLNVFFELFSVNFLFCVSACFIGYQIIPDFVKLWIGEKYILNSTTLILMLSILYINSFRITVDSFIFAYGIFQDIWAPIVETILNISFSIIFGYFWGLNGILSGVLVSLFIIVVLWRSYFLFKVGLKSHYIKYLKTYFKHLLAFVISIGIFDLIPDVSISNYDIVDVMIKCSVYPVILLILMLGLGTGIRQFLMRFFRLG